MSSVTRQFLADSGLNATSTPLKACLIASLMLLVAWGMHVRLSSRRVPIGKNDLPGPKGKGNGMEDNSGKSTADRAP